MNPGNGQNYSSNEQCYADMLEDDAVAGSLYPLIDSIAVPELVFRAPCDPELDEYLRLFMLLSGLMSVKREMIAEALIYGVSVSTHTWKMINSGVCAGWALPVDFECQAGLGLSFLTSSSGKIKEVRNGYRAIGGDVFIYKNSLLASDHCGRSILAPVVPLWKMKHEAYAMWLYWMRLFSNPAILATTGPDAEVVCDYDPVTDEVINEYDPVVGLYGEVSDYSGGSVFAFPHGYDIRLIQPEGKSEMWLNIIESLDIKIARAITSQSLATHSTGANSRAAAEVHSDMITRAAKAHLACYKRNILSLVVAGVERSFCSPNGTVDEAHDVPHRLSKIRCYWNSEDDVIDQSENCNEVHYAKPQKESFDFGGQQ